VVRAVFDSSVLVSALITPEGASGQLLDLAHSRLFTLCLSHEILAETAEALSRNHKLRTRYGVEEAAIEAFCDGLAALAEMVTDLPTLDAVPSDPKDNPIVATAVAERADYLVTGDRKHLLPLGRYGNVRIVAVRAFLELLGQA
jgi:putative PIN family toxin of toxin-antitoxin system